MGMTVNSKSVCRWKFKCHCCQAAPGKARVIERRVIKRRERQGWKAELRAA